ncbi:hypothetical protein FKM82_024662 [Ascaphus truei]
MDTEARSEGAIMPSEIRPQSGTYKQKDLQQKLGPKVELTSRRSPNLKDKLVHSHYSISSTTTFLSTFDKKGFFRCGGCPACKFTKPTSTFKDSKGTKEFTIKQFLNCRSKGVIYCLTCPCNKIYVGMTTREVRFRIMEHSRNIKTAHRDLESLKKITMVAKHFLQEHNADNSLLSAFAIERVSLGIRGGDLERTLLQHECRWIVMLGSMLPNGLNDYLGFSMFL